MIRPSPKGDFDTGFDADDEFMTPAAPEWDAGGDLTNAVDPFALGALGQPAPAQEAFPQDPFESALVKDPFAPEPVGADPFSDPKPVSADPFADLTPLRAGGSPVADVVAEAAAPAWERQVIEEPPHAVNAPMGDYSGGMGAGGETAAPSISIHIFCERPDTAQAAEAAAGDRRMARASTTVQPGGIGAAVDVYQTQPTPSLVIVESHDPGQVLLAQLDRLAEVCDPGTKVVVIGMSNDIALYRELMKRGVSEYLVPPINPLQIIQSITNLYSDPTAPFIGRTIAFIGAKGGVGASTIAHNFGHCLTETLQTNAVIADFDLPFGTAGLDFNQDPIQGVADALSQPDRLDPVLLDRMMARCTDRLSLFAAPATLDDDYDISPDAFEEVASKIRGTAPFVIMDLPHLWSSWMRKMLLSCDEVVVVATPDLASLRNGKNMIDLIRQARPNDQPPRLVLNQVGVPGRPEIPIKDFGDAIGLTPSLVLPFDAKLFGNAANNGQMICEIGPKTKAAEGLNQLARLITRREPPPAPKKSLFAGLLKK